MAESRKSPKQITEEIAALELEARFALRKLGGEKSSRHSEWYSSFLSARRRISGLEAELERRGLLP